MKRTALATALIIAATAAAPAAANDSGYKTSQGSMLSPVMAGVEVEPILTVGDVIDEYRFEAIPDGIALRTRGQGRVDVFVNHETSKVPFPVQRRAPTAPTARTTSTTRRSAGSSSTASRAACSAVRT